MNRLGVSSLATEADFRVIVVCRSISFDEGIGGMEKAASDHIKGLLGAGRLVILIAPREGLNGEVPPGLEWVDVAWPAKPPVLKRETAALRYLIWVKRVAKTLKRICRYGDVVHLHGASGGTLRYWRPLGSHAVAVVNPHGMEEFEPTSLLRGLPRRILRWMAGGSSDASVLIATDSSMVASVAKNYRVPSSSVVMIPNSVDFDWIQRFGGGRTETSDIPSAHFVSVGRLVPNKGYDLLATALAKLDAADMLPPEWTWIHFGDGDKRHLVESLAPSGHFEIRSRRSDEEVQRALAKAGIFVQPSRYEGSSLTTLEAMAHGRAIVACGVGGIPDKIADGVTGYICQPSTQSIADAIMRCISGSGRTGAAARQRAEEVFSLSAATRAYERAYIEALKKEGLL